MYLMMFYLLWSMNQIIVHMNFLKQCNLASKKYYLFVELPLNIYFLVRLILRGNIDHTKISPSIFHKSPLLKWSKSPQKWFNLTPGYGAFFGTMFSALLLHSLFSTSFRFDWPHEWPQLVPTLLSAVQDKDSKTQDGALITWQHLVKSLSSKRLCGDRRLFQDLTRDLFPFMIELYMMHLKLFLTEVI